MSDHGVVILTGKKLKNWLLDSKNQAALPSFLKQQLELGITISEQAESLNDLIDVALQCLQRDPGWIRFYRDNIEKKLLTQSSTTDQDAQEAFQVAQVEVDFGHALWLRDYPVAARHLEQALEKTFNISDSMGAWHLLWIGYCYELMGNIKEAHESYKRAHSLVKNIPPLHIQDISSSITQWPTQVVEVARYLHSGGPQMLREIPKRFDSDLTSLNGTGSSNQIEESIRALGQYLGLISSRPDKEFSTGPDVLWYTHDKPVLSLEIKVEKENKSVYQKKDLGQLRDHVRWVQNNISEDTVVFSAFVGPLLPASQSANPDAHIMVIELVEFKKIAERLRSALKDICTQALPTNLPQVILDIFQKRNLLWPGLYENMTKYLLHEIKVDQSLNRVDS